MLCLCILLFRTFAAEAYIVPTGSMAPTLLGDHRRDRLPELRYSGSRWGSTRRARADGRSARTAGRATSTARRRSSAAATGCWSRSSSTTSAGRSGGRSPSSTSRASRRRPTSSGWSACRASRSRSFGGDVVIDGRIARKTLREQRAMRILVYDNNFVPRDVDRYPRWLLPPGAIRAATGERLAGRGDPVRPRRDRADRPTGTRRSTGSSTATGSPDRAALRAGLRLHRLQRRRPAGREPGRRPDARGAG